MDDKKKQNPAVIALMVIAIVGFLGFAVKQAMVPDRAPASAAGTPAAPPPATPAPEPPVASRSVINPDAAPEADPFRPLPVKHSASRQATSAAAGPAVSPSPPPSVGPLPAPVLIARDRANRAAALQASTAEKPLPTLGGNATQPMPVAVEPSLVGTLLGSRPMALFKSENSTVMVPQGGAFMGWRIVHVGHGEATVWNGAATVRLRVGAPSTPVTRAATAPPAGRSAGAFSPASATGYAEANCIVVHYGRRTVPSKKEIVLGRREDGLEAAARNLDDAESQPTDETQPVAPPPSEPRIETDGT